MQYWKIEQRGAVMIAAYSNPPTNYMVAAAMAELNELIVRWAEPDVRAIVITGAVKDRFITHYSIEELVQMSSDPDLRESTYSVICGYQSVMRALAYLDKPIVVGMTGDTMGCGLELSLNCDIRVAQRGDYRIGFPEVALGILTGTGSQLLTRFIGHGRAMDFLMRSRMVNPEAALELGLVSELAEDAKARSIEIAEELSKLSSVSVTAAKRAINRGSDLPMEQGLKIEAEEFVKTIATTEALALMQDYIAQPFEQRRDWVQQHSVPAKAGNATGA